MDQFGVRWAMGCAMTHRQGPPVVLDRYLSPSGQPSSSTNALDLTHICDTLAHDADLK